MAKKTRTIISFSDDATLNVLDKAKAYGISDKNITVRKDENCQMIDIYSKGKKFGQICFEMGMTKLNAWW